MTIEMVDGIRVLKLHDVTAGAEARQDDLAMLHLWRLLTGGHGLRDAAAVDRRFL